MGDPFDLLGDPADRLTAEEYTEAVRLLVENLATEDLPARSESVRPVGEPDLQQWAKERAETGLMNLAGYYPEITESRRMLDFWPEAAMREAVNNNDRKAFGRALRRYMVAARHEAVRIRRRRSGQGQRTRAEQTLTPQQEARSEALQEMARQTAARQRERQRERRQEKGEQ